MCRSFGLRDQYFRNVRRRLFTSAVSFVDVLKNAGITLVGYIGTISQRRDRDDEKPSS